MNWVFARRKPTDDLAERLFYAGKKPSGEIDLRIALWEFAKAMRI